MMSRQKRRQLAGGSPCGSPEKEDKKKEVRRRAEVEDWEEEKTRSPLVFVPSYLPRRRDHENGRAFIGQPRDGAAVRRQDDGRPPPAGGFPADAVGKVLKERRRESGRLKGVSDGELQGI